MRSPVTSVGAVLFAVAATSVLVSMPTRTSDAGPGSATVTPEVLPLDAPPAGPNAVAAPVAVPAKPARAAKPAMAGGAARAAKPGGAVAVQVAGPSGQSTVWLDGTEVTVSRFEACVKAGACKADQFVIEPNSTCNYGAKGRGEHPMNCVDWNGADAYCHSAGGRLCTEDEWFAGCRGPSGDDYPYGTEYEPGACNALGRTGPVAATDQGTSAVGEYQRCQGSYSGLYDMVGNVAEWLDSCKGEYCHFYGGAFLENDPVPDFASCKRFCAGNQKVFRSSTIGFRCCYDKEPKGR